MTGKREKFLSSLYNQEDVYAKGKELKPTLIIPTPSPSLNWALGGGIPVGYLIQHAGAPSSGKSLVAMIEAVGWQKYFKEDSIIVIADFEHTTTLERCAQIGIDTSKDKLIIWKREDNSGAAFFDWLNNEFLPGCIDTGLRPFIILDSKDDMVPPGEAGRGSAEMEMGSMAKFLKRVLKRSVALLAKTNGTMVIINQLVLQIGMIYGNPETTSGGNALKHNSSVDIWFKKVDKKDELILDSREETIGHKVTFKIPKNKISAPFRKGAFRILYKGKIVDQHLEIYEMAKRLGVVARPTNRSWQMDFEEAKEGRYWSSKGDFQEAIRTRSEIRDELLKRFENYEEWANKFDSKKDIEKEIEE